MGQEADFFGLVIPMSGSRLGKSSLLSRVVDLHLGDKQLVRHSAKENILRFFLESEDNFFRIFLVASCIHVHVKAFQDKFLRIRFHKPQEAFRTHYTVTFQTPNFFVGIRVADRTYHDTVRYINISSVTT